MEDEIFTDASICMYLTVARLQQCNCIVRISGFSRRGRSLLKRSRDMSVISVMKGLMGWEERKTKFLYTNLCLSFLMFAFCEKCLAV